MSALFKPNESCVEMTMSNGAIGVLGGSIAGFAKSSYYMGPRVPSVPISKLLSSLKCHAYPFIYSI